MKLIRILFATSALTTLSNTYGTLPQGNILEKFNSSTQVMSNQECFNRRLKNENKSDVKVYKNREDNYKVEMLIVTSSVREGCGDYSSVLDALYPRGASVNYFVKSTGEVEVFVKSGLVAFVAGSSSWSGKKSNENKTPMGYSVMNEESESVMLDHPVYNKTKNLKIKGYDGPVQIKGCNFWWYPISEIQHEATCKLLVALRDKYEIDDRFVVSLGDISDKGMIGVGPMFDWKKAREKYGLGVYPLKEVVTDGDLEKFNKLTFEDYIGMFKIFGYEEKENEEIVFFKYHFGRRNDAGVVMNLSQKLEDADKVDILNLMLNYYKDLKEKSEALKPTEKDFMKKFKDFVTQHEKDTPALLAYSLARNA